jgi:predicted nuclease of predicted toxin-antitoxin system
VRVLLDENIPVGLARRLMADGWDVEHPILLGSRGLPDSYFLMRLTSEPGLVFLTQDEDFAEIPSTVAGQVVISRVRQERTVAERIELWTAALASLRRDKRPERLLDLLDDGRILAWEIHEH